MPIWVMSGIVGGTATPFDMVVLNELAGNL
jgi:hypothetical protein